MGIGYETFGSIIYPLHGAFQYFGCVKDQDWFLIDTVLGTKPAANVRGDVMQVFLADFQDRIGDGVAVGVNVLG